MYHFRGKEMQLTILAVSSTNLHCFGWKLFKKHNKPCRIYLTLPHCYMFCNLRMQMSKLWTRFSQNSVFRVRFSLYTNWLLYAHFFVAGHICDTINGNESHVGNFQVWFFNINYLSISNATFRSKPHLNWTSGCRDMNNSLKFLNNVKHKNLSPLLAYNSKSIFLTSNAFTLLIMSHI